MGSGRIDPFDDSMSEDRATRIDGMAIDETLRSQRQRHLAMNLLLLLALAVPLSCLAFLSSLALLSVMTLGGIIRVLGTVKARRPQ
jgi:hypothetical protein